MRRVLGLIAVAAAFTTLTASLLAPTASAKKKRARGRAVGFWSDGSLRKGKALAPTGDHHYILYPTECYLKLPMAEAYPEGEKKSNFWAHPTVVKAMKGAARAVRRAYRDAPKLPIGELCNEHGGKIPFHRSHQNGLDADIFFLMRPSAWAGEGSAWTNREQIVDLCRDGPHAERFDPRTGKWRVHPNFVTSWNWKVVEYLAKREDVKLIFIGKLLRRQLLRWAKRHKVPEDVRTVVKDKLQTPFCRGKSGIGTSAYKGNYCAHDDHIHVRFHCPKDSPDCRETKKRAARY